MAIGRAVQCHTILLRDGYRNKESLNSKGQEYFHKAKLTYLLDCLGENIDQGIRNFHVISQQSILIVLLPI